MGVVKGWKKYLTLSEEPVWGVKATTFTRFLEFDSEGLEKPIAEVLDTGIRGSAGQARRLQGQITPGGPIGDFSVFPEGGFPLIAKVALGEVNSSQPDVTGNPTVWRHVINPLDLTPYGDGKGLTVRIGRDIKILDFYGGVIQLLNLASSAGGPVMKGNISLLFKNQDYGVDSIPSYPIVNPFTHFQGVWTVDGSPAKIGEWAFAYNNNYKEDWFAAQAIREGFPRNGRRDVSGSFTLPTIESFALYDKFVSGADATLNVKYTGALISGTYNYSIEVDFPKIYYNGPTAPGSGGPAVPNIVVPFRAIEKVESALKEVKITITSTESSI